MRPVWKTKANKDVSLPQRTGLEEEEGASPEALQSTGKVTISLRSTTEGQGLKVRVRVKGQGLKLRG